MLVQPLYYGACEISLILEIEQLQLMYGLPMDSGGDTLHLGIVSLAALEEVLCIEFAAVVVHLHGSSCYT